MAWKQAGLDRFAALNPRRMGMYLGAGEGSLDFDNFAAANIAGWTPDAPTVDAAPGPKPRTAHERRSARSSRSPTSRSRTSRASSAAAAPRSTA
jgi:hypothetical protein